jgi:SAM-dependent methyltransferase
MIRRVLGRVKRRLFPVNETLQAAAAHWDQQITVGGLYWMQHPRVAEYANTLVTGIPFLGPTQGLKVGWAYRALPRGLSIGCGPGALERDLYNLHICDRMDAFDISRESLRTARRLARESGTRNVRYRRADFNTVRLPASRYDIVFFHGSLHHVGDPDRLLTEVEKTLKPGGLLYLNEYVGPSRDEWADREFADRELVHARNEFAALPGELKLQEPNPPIEMRDPSEMARSSRIVDAVHERFEMLHDRPYWGNLLYPIFCWMNETILQPEHEPVVLTLIEREKELVASGAFTKPYYAVMLGRKRFVSDA